MILLNTYVNSDGTSSGEMGLILLFILMLPVLIFIIIPGIVDFSELFKDLRSAYKVKVFNVSEGLKYILLSMDIKEKDIKGVYRIKYFKKIDTHYSYQIKLNNGKTFYLYFTEVDKKGKWFIYKRKCFDNKPIPIKDNYYDIIEKVNNKLYNKIKNNFHNRLKEQTVYL